MKRWNKLPGFGLFAAMLILGLFVSAHTYKRNHSLISQKAVLRDSLHAVSITTARKVFFAGMNVDSSGSVEDQVIAFAKSFLGIPYFYTGKSPRTGFDCSGFTSYVFKKFGYDVSPASKEQVNAGHRIPLEDARKGDLLIFTGTNLSIRQPGHVGIVISPEGERPIKFIHSSSASSHYGVSISQLDGTRYEQRLLQVRRVLTN